MDTAKGTPKALDRKASFLLITTLVFALYWAWQTCMLYMPIVESGAEGISALWYAYNGFGCIGYALAARRAPQLQERLNSRGMYVFAALCIVLATILGFALSFPLFTDTRLFVLLFVVENVFIAAGGALFTAMRFHLLTRIKHNTHRSLVLFVGTVVQLLIFTCVSNLPTLILFIVLLAIPLSLPFLIKKACTLDTQSKITEGSAQPSGATSKLPGISTIPHFKLPKMQLLAFFLLAFSLNLIRSEIDANLVAYNLEPNYTISLAMLAVALAAIIELFAQRWFTIRISPFIVTAFASVSIFITFFNAESASYAPVFSSAAFYLFVILFWENTAGYCVGSEDRTVWVSSITHLIYVIGLLTGTSVFKMLATSDAPNAIASLLFAAYTALIGAFFLYAQQGKKQANMSRKFLSTIEYNQNDRSLESVLSADCLIIASNYDLTEREYDVLRALSTGRSLKAIAEELNVSENTIKSHVTHIYGKMRIHSREELMEVIFSIDKKRHQKTDQ